MFYESDPLTEMPALELPNFQYGPLLTNPRRNNFSLLEPVRGFLWQNYGLYRWTAPKTSIINAQAPPGVLPYQQVEDRVQLPPKSWLIAVACVSGGERAADGFRFQIWDEGAQDYCLSDGSWINWTDFLMDPAAGGRPFILPEKYLVVAPGALQIKIVNLSASNNNLSLMLDFAVPKVMQQGKLS